MRYMGLQTFVLCLHIEVLVKKEPCCIFPVSVFWELSLSVHVLLFDLTFKGVPHKTHCV